jgi:hypothetical protein
VASVLSGPMRRTLVLAGALLAGLLVAVPALAAAAAPEVERDVAFSFDAEGFAVRVDVDNNDGDVNATIILSRGPLVAYYSAPAKVTADRVTAQFGRLGELDYYFTPKRNGSVDCEFAEEGEAVFEGTFVFTGESGYVHIEAPAAEGSFRIDPVPKNCAQKRLARRVVPYSPTYSGEGATLEAGAGSWAQGRPRELNVFDLGKKGPHQVVVDAFLGEKREGMSVARGVQLIAGSGAFRWDLEKGTATLRPPKPFTGSATFTRRSKGRPGTWKGSLGMPILGGNPVRLAGAEFHAVIHKGLPQDE